MTEQEEYQDLCEAGFVGSFEDFLNYKANYVKENKKFLNHLPKSDFDDLNPDDIPF